MATLSRHTDHIYSGLRSRSVATVSKSRHSKISLGKLVVMYHFSVISTTPAFPPTLGQSFVSWVELVGLCLRIMLEKKKILFLTLESQRRPHPGDPETFWGHDRLCSLDLGGTWGTYAHSVEGPKEFSLLSQLSHSLPVAKDQLICSWGNQKPRVVRGKIPQLCCPSPYGEW